MIEAASSRRRPIVVATIAIAAAVVIAIGLAASRSLAAEPDEAPSSHIEYLPSTALQGGQQRDPSKDSAAFAKAYADLTTHAIHATKLSTTASSKSVYRAERLLRI